MSLQSRKTKKIVKTRLNIYREKGTSQHGIIGNMLTGEIKIAGRTNMVYVTSMNGVVSEVLNRRAPNIYKLPVLYGYDPADMPNTLQVLSAWDVFANVDDDNAANNLTDHHEQHEWPHSDTVHVLSEQWMPGLPYPGTGLTVKIYPNKYYIATGWLDVKTITTVDLSAVSPALTAGQARYVLIVVDSTGAFAARVGTTITGFDNLVAADIPAPSTGDNTICAVKMFYSQTVFRKDGNNNDFTDLRFAVSARSLDWHYGQLAAANTWTQKQTMASADIGGATNYLSVSPSGILTLHGAAVVENDLAIGAHSLRSGATPPTWTAYNGTLYAPEFINAATTDLHGSFELLHDYKDGSNLTFHIHWSPSTTNTGNCKWGLDYSICNIDGTWAAPTTVTITPAASGVVRKHTLTDVTVIVGTGLTKGATIDFRIYRLGADAADTFTGAAYLHNCGIHYLADKLGS